MSKYLDPKADLTFKKVFGEHRAEGEKQKAFEMAVKMKRKGYSVEDICEISGLSPEEIETL
jgi:hypothetical protein